jgi:hypothetical protein
MGQVIFLLIVMVIIGAVVLAFAHLQKGDK